jgi:uncharacterized Tic20 family protein
MSDQQWGPPYGGPGPSSSDDTTWAVLAHIGSLVAAWLAMGFLAPLAVMLTKGTQSPFVRRHAVESLNFQLSLLIYLVVGSIVSVVLFFLTFGLFLIILVPAAVLLGIGALVVIILASVKASQGEDYRYPLTIRIVR